MDEFPAVWDSYAITSARKCCLIFHAPNVRELIVHCKLVRMLDYKPAGWCSLRFLKPLTHTWHMVTSMVLQPFVGPWPLLLFRDLFYTDGRTPWTGDEPVARPLPTHRINVHTHICALSGIRTDDPSVRGSKDSACLRPRGHCDGRVNVEYRIQNSCWNTLSQSPSMWRMHDDIVCQAMETQTSDTKLHFILSPG
jgi:hypothetical protein